MMVFVHRKTYNDDGTTTEKIVAVFREESEFVRYTTLMWEYHKGRSVHDEFKKIPLLEDRNKYDIEMTVELDGLVTVTYTSRHSKT